MTMVNLHAHSTYSTLDGMCKIDELAKRAKELGQPAIAVTDHGNMSATYELYKACKKNDIQPIFGIEFYHRVPAMKKRCHLIAYAKSMKGLKNLYALHELSWRNAEVGAFGKRYPIVTYEDLFQHKEGIIISTACIAGHIPRLIMDKCNDVYNVVESLKAQFEDDFYLELQCNSIPEQRHVNQELLQISKLYNVPIILTSDTHYLLQKDYSVHEMLLCMQSKQKMSNPKRFRFSSNDYWLKSEEEMIYQAKAIELHIDDIEQALRNTVNIAKKCNFEFEIPKPEDCLPRFADNEKLMLRQKANEGWAKKHPKNKDASKRISYELNVLEQKGYSGYYLIVQDYINWAKDNEIIVGPGRGSGCGSMLAYLIDMSNINSMDWNLLFERFLNPERLSSPDWDADFSDRDKMVDYLRERWGEENVSSIVAFGTLTAKAVIRKTMGIHDFTQAQINEVTKSLPKKLDLTLKDCEQSDVFKRYKKTYPQIFNAMYRLEGVIDHTSTHAAGVLITPKAVREFVPPLYDHENNIMVSGFDKYMLEDLGLYKFDILKLTTLNVLDGAVKLIREFERVDIDLEYMTYNDSAIYEDLCKGNVFGVFQFESQTDIVQSMQPRCFEDIMAITSLIRPGVGDKDEYIARKNGKQFKYYHEDEIPYMSSTYGLIVYQEQVMLRVHTLAGWTLGQGDKLRKHRTIADDIELANKYVEDCIKLGKITKQQAVSSWQEIVDCINGGYGFNKSHACAYSDITYKTAWLKHYYPKHFMSALMTTERTDQSKIAERVNQCKVLGIKILPPDVNKSDDTYIFEPDGIRYSINSIKGVGDNALKDLLENRPYTDLKDLFDRVNKRVVDKTVVTALIKSGCFDYTKEDRYALLHQYFSLRGEKRVSEEYRDRQTTEEDISAFEKETLGLYLTSSPFDRYNFKALEEFPNQGIAVIGGEITKSKVIFDKNNRKMAFITLTTEYCNIEVIVFAREYKKLEAILKEGNLVMCKGKRDNSKLLVNEVTMLD